MITTPDRSRPALHIEIKIVPHTNGTPLTSQQVTAAVQALNTGDVALLMQVFVADIRNRSSQ
ncbi:hypothetical protein [Deinococcus sp. QL22]|uniref:hypothetical protein n=1 Tax=Deinococcus sp. QL22 TaxID=2939437 RepID=UPI00201807F6|nr:hypothetical protein [Deinococcus sp. QL22]UQN06467.1 hypothetical protein M1R55_00690 [Deinococcus sp. QL22]